MLSSIFRVALKVSGRVQGVGFRYFTLEAAESVGGITGFVRNEYSDRGVEIYAEGSKADLERFVSSVKEGPALSHISDVSIDWRPIERRQYESFTITD